MINCSQCGERDEDAFYSRWDRKKEHRQVTQPCKSCIASNRATTAENTIPTPCPCCGKLKVRTWRWVSPKGTIWDTCRSCRDTLDSTDLAGAQASLAAYREHNREVEGEIMAWKGDRLLRFACGGLVTHKRGCEAHEGIWRRIVVILAKG